MSEELKDLRTKVTRRTNAVLEALNRATGRDKSEIAREILARSTSPCSGGDSRR